MIRNYRDLSRLQMEKVDKENTIILIPLGALEQHGNQAPLGTDDIIAEAMVRHVVDRFREIGREDFPMLIFPVIPVGLSTEHKNFCGSITFRPETYYHILYDICESISRHGFKKIAFLICHGGNAPVVQVLSREVRADLGLMAFVISSGAFSRPEVKATISEGNIHDFHGGEMETSMVMAVDESLVDLSVSEAGEPTSFVGLKKLAPYGGCTISWMSEDWKTQEGKPIGIGGNPKGANAEKGETILKVSAEEIVDGLLEISQFKL